MDDNISAVESKADAGNMIALDYFITVGPTTVLFLNYVVVVLILTLKRRKFNSSFYTVTLAQSVVDIVLFLFVQIWQRGRKYGYLESFFILHRTGFVPYLSFSVTYYLKVVQYLGMLTLAFNRFSTFCVRSHYELWSTKGIILMTLVQWAIPLLMLLFFAFTNYKISFELIMGQWRSDTHPFYTLWFSVVECIAGLAVLGISLLFNVLAILEVRRQHSFGDENAKKSYSLEIRFLMASFAVFLFLSLDILFNVTQTLFSIFDNKSAVKLMGTIWYILGEFCCLSRPVSLLATSAALRKEYGNIFCRVCKPKPNKKISISRIETHTLF